MARFDLGQAMLNLGGPGLLNLARDAKACQEVSCQQRALFGRKLERFGFEGGELGRHGEIQRSSGEFTATPPKKPNVESEWPRAAFRARSARLTGWASSRSLSPHVDEVNNVRAASATNGKRIICQRRNDVGEAKDFDVVTGDELQFFFGLHNIHHEFR